MSTSVIVWFLYVLWFCIPGSQGVYVVMPVPDPGPGGGRDRGGLRGVLSVSAQQHVTDGAGGRRDVDKEQGE